MEFNDNDYVLLGHSPRVQTNEKYMNGRDTKSARAMRLKEIMIINIMLLGQSSQINERVQGLQDRVNRVLTTQVVFIRCVPASDIGLDVVRGEDTNGSLQCSLPPCCVLLINDRDYGSCFKGQLIFIHGCVGVQCLHLLSKPCGGWWTKCVNWPVKSLYFLFSLTISP